MNYLLLVMQLLPSILEAIKMLERVFPQQGVGEMKKEVIVETLKQGFIQAQAAGQIPSTADWGRLITMILPIVEMIVNMVKRTTDAGVLPGPTSSGTRITNAVR